MLTGEVKFRTQPSGARVYLDHANALDRLARSGHGWARAALDPTSPFIFVSASGFTDSFHEVTEEGWQVIALVLEDLFPRSNEDGS